MKRRQFIKAASGLFLAPAIVRAESIMRVKPVVIDDDWFYEALDKDMEESMIRTAENMRIHVTEAEFRHFADFCAGTPKFRGYDVLSIGPSPYGDGARCLDIAIPVCHRPNRY